MIKKKEIKTTNAPKALGPYSQGLIYKDLIFVSGQIPLDPKTNEIVKGDIEVQTKRSLDNIKGILKEAKAGFKDILKLTVFLKDINDFSKVNEIFCEYFKDTIYPTRTVVGGVSLPRNSLIKIDVIAINPKK